MNLMDTYFPLMVANYISICVCYFFLLHTLIDGSVTTVLSPTLQLKPILKPWSTENSESYSSTC